MQENYYPPAGTYPSKNAPPVMTEPTGGTPPDSPKKVWRVGTLTMALALIAVGVLLILSIFVPALDVVAVAQFSPVILILLGAELLVAAVRHKDASVRYDGLSVFVSLILIAVSLAAAVVPQVIWRDYQNDQAGRRLAAELELESAEVMRQAGLADVSSIEWYVSIHQGQASEDTAPQDLKAGDYIQMRVYMPGDYADEKAFAAKCSRVLDAARQLVPHIDYASVYGYREAEEGSYIGPSRYALWLENAFQAGTDAARMDEFVEQEYWWEEDGYEGFYASRDYYEARLAEQEAARDYDDAWFPSYDVDTGAGRAA